MTAVAERPTAPEIVQFASNKFINDMGRLLLASDVSFERVDTQTVEALCQGSESFIAPAVSLTSTGKQVQLIGEAKYILTDELLADKRLPYWRDTLHSRPHLFSWIDKQPDITDLRHLHNDSNRWQDITAYGPQGLIAIFAVRHSLGPAAGTVISHK